MKYTIKSYIDRRGERYWWACTDAYTAGGFSGTFDTWMDAIYYVCTWQGRRYPC